MIHSGPSHPKRPTLALLCGELTPYRIHWHERIVHELPGIELRTLLFPYRIKTPWTLGNPEGIGLIRFDADRPPQPVPPARASLGFRIRTTLAEWRESFRVLRWISENDPDVVLCNGYSGPPFFHAIIWCWMRGTPVMVWADNNIHGERQRGLLGFVKQVVVRVLCRMCSAMLPCGQFGVRFFAKYSRRPGRVFMCPYEPDYDEIAATPRERIERVRTEYALDSARKRFVAVNRLVRAKRVDTIIDAFVLVAEQRPDWDVVIVGQGPDRESLEARVPAHIRNRVKFVGFIGDQRTINALYRNCDCMVLASEYEPWALVVNEAAAGGLALICSEVVGAAAELVREGVNGCLFPPGDVRALAACMLEVSDKVNLSRMKTASAEVVADWRRRADPVDGLRAALDAVGIDAGHAP